MPGRVRRRLAVAAAADLWSSLLWAVLNPLFGNCFPIAREGPLRPSLENMGRILDDNWSVLIYPEGDLYVGRTITPFKPGIGFVAVRGGLPVIPLRVHVHDFGRPAFLPLLPRGRVEVRFGTPLTFHPNTANDEATRAIENAVRSL